MALGFAVGLSDGMALGMSDGMVAWVCCRVERRHVARWHGAWVCCRVERRHGTGMSDGMSLGLLLG